MTISERLKDLRVAAGFKTQREFADKLDADVQLVGRWERSERVISEEWIPRIAAALGVSIATLFADQPEAASSIDACIQAFLPHVSEKIVVPCPDAAMTGAGLEAGDRLVFDLDRRPERGQIVLADLRHDEPAQIVRLYEPPFLLAASFAPEFRRPILLDGETVRVIAVYCGLIRAG